MHFNCCWRIRRILQIRNSGEKKTVIVCCLYYNYYRRTKQQRQQIVAVTGCPSLLWAVRPSLNHRTADNPAADVYVCAQQLVSFLVQVLGLVPEFGYKTWNCRARQKHSIQNFITLISHLVDTARTYSLVTGPAYGNTGPFLCMWCRSWNKFTDIDCHCIRAVSRRKIIICLRRWKPHI